MSNRFDTPESVEYKRKKQQQPSWRDSCNYITESRFHLQNAVKES